MDKERIADERIPSPARDAQLPPQKEEARVYEPPKVESAENLPPQCSF